MMRDLVPDLLADNLTGSPRQSVLGVGKKSDTAYDAATRIEWIVVMDRSGLA